MGLGNSAENLIGKFMRARLDFELKLRKIPIIFKDISIENQATAEGNNAAWYDA
jgi:hypothetical protein